MDKLAKILDALREQDLLDRKRESRLGERQGFALDRDALLNPTERQFGELDSWLKNLDALYGKPEQPEIAGWGSEVDESTNSQPVAWYQPLTYYHETAGIFLTDFGIWQYAKAIKQIYIEQNRQQLFRTPLDIDANVLIRVAIEMLLSHEAFHHDVEWFALKQSATHRSHWLYPEYDRNVYHQSAPLEEALATARMQLAFHSKKLIATYGEALCRNVVLHLEDEVKSLPLGYCDANSYSSTKSFRFGIRQLAASINQTSLTPRFTPTGAHFGIGKGALHDYFRENVTLVPWNQGSSYFVPPSSFTFSIPSRDIKRFLTSRGYWETNLGNGSHRVWKHKTLKAITLPARGNFEGYQVLKNICQGLQIDGFEALREAVADL